MKKQVFIKTYSKTGTFKGVFFDFAFSSFTKSLNGGLGDLRVVIPRKFDEFSTNDDIELGNELKIFIADDEAPNGLQIYSGEIDDITPSVGTTESVQISCSGYIYQLATDILEYSSSTIYKAYGSQDISAILKDMLDNYQARRDDDRITYDVGATTIDSAGKNIILKIYLNSPLQALSHTAQQADSDWFWRIGVDNNFYFNAIPTKATHLFQFGKDVASLSTNRNIRETKTGIMVTNGLASGDGDAILKLYSDATAITTYGRRFKSKRDGRYKAGSSTADEFGARFVALFKDPINTVNLRILDSNLANGYDIENIEPGDTCKITNIESNDALTSNMLITTVTYNTDYVDLTVMDTNRYVDRQFMDRKDEHDLVAYTDDQKQTYDTANKAEISQLQDNGGALILNRLSGQQFTSTATGILNKVEVKLSKTSVQDPNPTFHTFIYSDNGSDEPNVVLKDLGITEFTDVGGYTQVFTFTGVALSITDTIKYWIVIDGLTADGKGFSPAWRYQTGNPYAGGLYKRSSDDGVTWPETITGDTYFSLEVY